MAEPNYKDWVSSLTTDQCFDLQQREIAIRNKFVEFYLEDYDEKNACLKMGHDKQYAQHYGQEFLKDSYVLQRIAKKQREIIADPKLQEDTDKALAMNTLRQAMQAGPFSSRIAATRQLAEMYGWNKAPDTGAASELIVNAFKEFAKAAPV